MTSTLPNPAVSEFVMDEAYYREFHDEWIKTLGRGWRIERVMISLCIITAVGLACVVLALGRAEGLWVAVVLLAIACFEMWKRSHRRRLWLLYQREQPGFGKTLRIVVRDGDLVQEKDFPGDPRFERTSDMLETPNGYLLRYVAPVPMDMPSSVSGTWASVYIPHRSITPPMARSEFVALVPALRCKPESPPE